MRMAYDFSPLYRSMIGVDRIAGLLESAMASEQGADYPPFNIEKTGADSYRVSMAVAGFDPADLEVTTQPNLLIVAGRPTETQEPREYLYHGIAAREFERRFELDDHVVVKSAEVVNGLLNIHLVREVPEALKPRKIKIDTTETSRFHQLDHKQDERHAA